MMISEVFMTLMLMCNSVPKDCLVVDDPKEYITHITICNKKLPPKYTFFLFDEKYPEQSRKVIFNTECISS